MKRASHFLLSITGFISTIGQMVVIQELYFHFADNEISISIVIFSWLTWHAFGAYLLPKMFDYFHISIPLSLLLFLLPLFLDLAIIGIRFANILLRITPGESLGIVPLLITSILLLFPFCSLSGFSFTRISQHLKTFESSSLQSIRRIYILENIGAAIGGICFSFILLPLFSSLEVTTILWIVTMGILSLFGVSKKVSIGSILGLLFLFPVVSKVETKMNTLNWQGQVLQDELRTPKGILSATRLGEQVNIYLNAHFISSHPDPYGVEASTHLAMLQHPCPESVLLIGNCNQKTYHELAKYPNLEFIDGIDMHPDLPAFIDKNIQEIDLHLTNIQFHFHKQDIGQFLRKNNKKYDVIIMSLPSPVSLAINRFYTSSFFNQLKRHLKVAGIVCITLEGSENAYGPELVQYLKSIWNTLQSAFPNLAVLPGEQVRLLASSDSAKKLGQVNTMIARLQHKKLDTQYIQPYYLPYEYSVERIENFHLLMEKTQLNWINRTLHPVSFYFNSILWSTHYSSWLRPIFQFFISIHCYWWIVSCLFVLVAIYFIIRFFRIGRQQTLALIQLSIFYMGFSGIAIEIILLFAYQLFRGDLITKIAFLISGYMTGLAIGAAIFPITTKKKLMGFDTLSMLHGFVVCLLIFLSGFFIFLDAGGQQWLSDTILDISFFALTGWGGLLGGLQFMIATDMVTQKLCNTGQAAGTNYATDLLGAAIGTLITGLVLIPVLGITMLLTILIGINTLLVGIFIFEHFKRKSGQAFGCFKNESIF